MKYAIRGVLLTGLVFTAGCASAPTAEPTLQTGPNAEVTIDGLVRVDNPSVGIAYRKPDIDLTPYKRFSLDPVEIAYQKDPGGRRQSMGGGESNFALTKPQMESLRERFREAIVKALTENNGYTLTTETGPDVLRINASLIDLVVAVPTQETGGRGGTYARSYGLVSLILEMYDSESGEILVRAGDRRDPTRNTDIHMASVNTAFVRADVDRMFEYWANLLRERMDSFKGPGK